MLSHAYDKQCKPLG